MELLKMSISSSVLILAVVIIRAFLLQKLPKTTFRMLWGAVLCRMLLPFSIPSRFSIYNAIHMLNNQVQKADSLNASALTTAGGIKAVTSVPYQSAPGGTGVSVAFVIWGIGVLLCIFFFLRIHLHCRIRYNASLPVDNGFIINWQKAHPVMRKLQIRKSDQIAAPLTYGILKPVILLPDAVNTADETELCYILTHEYVHIRRFDTLTKLFLAAALCIHWFNPFVFIMYVLANRDIELSCDEAVVHTFGITIKSAYAQTLIELEEKRSRLDPLVNNFSRNAIEERIVSIMKIKKASLAGAALAFLLVICTVVVFATNAAAAEADSSQQTNVATADYPAVTSDSTASIAKTNETTVENDKSQAEPVNPSNQELSERYGSYGITFDVNGKMLYHNELVRYFWDGAWLDENENTAVVCYEYLNEAGTVDVHTTRKATDNGDGSVDPLGKLTGIVKYSQEAFNQRNLSDLKDSYGETTNAPASEGTDSDASDGHTIAQILSRYKAYGIEYKEKQSSNIGNIYYKGKLIKTFIDEKPDGGVFSCQSADGGSIVIRTTYSKAGKLVGVTKE